MTGRMSVVEKVIPSIITGLFIIACLWYGADRAYAEGSRELVETPSGVNDAYRPYLGWRPWTTNYGIPDRTTFKVYVKAGETIYLGSSVHQSYLDADNGETAVSEWDIVVTSPTDVVYRLNVVNGGSGHIDSPEKERRGPKPLDSGGYDPLVIDAGETGWWTVEFHGEKNQYSVGTLDPVAKKADEPWGTQNANIAAWDVTVADSDGNEKKGRMYSTFLSISTGWGEAPIHSRFYVLTKDGYLYKVHLNGIKPYGFIVFANNRGFIDATTGETLNRSVLFENIGGSSKIRPEANIVFQNPALEDDIDVTHRLFLNPPSEDLPEDWLAPIPVPEPAEVAFQGRTANKAVVGEGGNFRFTIGEEPDDIEEEPDASRRFTFQLIIDADQDGEYEASDGAGDIVIDSVAKPGFNEIEWNGKRKNGTDVPVGNYTAKIMMKGGEYHFPMFDVEKAENGIKIEALNAPGGYPSDKNNFFIYYNDLSYTTGSGFYMNLDGSGGHTPRDASDGEDSSAGGHKFTDNYGDNKGIDTWTYYPGPEVVIPFSIMNGPTAIDPGMIEVDEDDSVAIGLNGTDTETAPQDLSFDIVKKPEHGAAVLNGNEVTYTPEPNYHGTDSFQFVAIDEDGVESMPVTVDITVRPVNDIPAAISKNVTTAEDKPVSILLEGTDVEDKDPDQLTYTLVSLPANGKGVLNGRVYTYTPDPYFNGNDSFSFTVTDSVYAVSAPAVVTIQVVPVDNEPLAQDQTADTDEDTPLDIVLTGWDAETSADDLSYTVVSGPSHGTLSGTGRFLTYTPNPDYHGTDSFAFTVTDSVYTSRPGTVTIAVRAVNDRPSAADQSVTTRVNHAVDVLLVGSDVETPAGQLIFDVIQGPEHGTLSGFGRELVYTPDSGFQGTDRFTYTVTDLGDGAAGPLTSLPAVVTITVSSPPSPPADPVQNEPDPREEEIVIDTEFGIRVVETKIRRTHLPDGTAHDEVLLSEREVTEAMLRLDEAGLDTALVVLPDEEDIVVDTYVEVPQVSLQKFIDHGKHLELLLEYAKIEVPFTSMAGFGEDLYFRIVPIKDEETRKAILHRAGEDGMLAEGGEHEFRILGRPMRIETNMQSRPVKIALPLYDALPVDEDERKQILDNLVIYIEHSDGTKEVVRGAVTGYKTGEDLGIEFVIDKFSTFTMIYWTGAKDYFADGGGGPLPFELVGKTGYLTGYPDGTFRPDHSITRAEMAVILAKNVLVGDPDGVWPAFPDVPETHWAWDFIKPVTESGLMIGYPVGSFRPDHPITRAEMAIIALRLSGLSEKDGETFTDTKGHWASGAIESLAAAGLLKGYPDGSYKPDRPITRAEAVVLFNRLLGIAPLSGDIAPSWPDVPSTHWAFRDIEAATERKVQLTP